MSDLTDAQRIILASALSELRREIDDVGFNVSYMSSRVARDSLGELHESLETMQIIIEEKGLTV